MKKILLSALTMLLVCSCLNYGYSLKYDGMESYCEGKLDGYRRLTDAFKFRDKPDKGGYDDLKFTSVSDSVWIVKYNGYTTYKSRYDSYLDNAKITVGQDSSVTVFFDSHETEGEFDIHVFSPAPGIVNDKGTIRVEVSKNGTPQGWGQIDLKPDERKITTGAY